MSIKLISNKIILCGFSAAGKSQVLSCLKNSLEGFIFNDTDLYIESKLGLSIPDFIKEKGEEEFRLQELEAIKEILQIQTPQVISLGGGTLTKKETRELLSSAKDSFTIYLSASIETLWQRVLKAEDLTEKLRGAKPKNPLRPLLLENGKYSKEKLSSLLNERIPSYEEAYDLKIETDFLNEVSIASVIKSFLEKQDYQEDSKNKIIIAPAELKPGKISSHYAGSKVRNELATFTLKSFPKLKKLSLIIDKNIESTWGKEVEQLFLTASKAESREIELVKVLIPAGEKSKCFKVFEEASEKLSSAGLSREDAIVCIGGGVIGDLGGLLASTFLRGVGLIHLASSVVAQVDSSIGGKTGINLSTGKNLVGTFYPASGVFLDTDLLKSLPEREYLSGLAEVIKYGAIFDNDFLNYLLQHRLEILNRESKNLEYVIEKCLNFKINTVAADLEDKNGRRALLNFGHTFGHAIEKLGAYEYYLHGEAISIGMHLASRIGENFGITNQGSAEKLKNVFKEYSLPVSLKDEFSDSYLEKAGRNKLQISDWRKALLQDKKSLGDTVNFVFLEKLGKAFSKEYEVDELLFSIDSELKL